MKINMRRDSVIFHIENSIRGALQFTSTIFLVVLKIAMQLATRVSIMDTLEVRAAKATQLLDVMDYISNSFLMPLISFLTCVFVGWVVGPKWIEEEMESRYTAKPCIPVRVTPLSSVRK